MRRPSVARARLVHFYPLLDTAVMGTHHVNAVTEIKRLVNIVGDEQEGNAALFDEFQN